MEEITSITSGSVLLAAMINFLVMFMKHWAVSESLKAVIKFVAFSIDWVSFGSMGIRPRKGTLPISASDSPPPEEKMLVHSEQWGHTYPLIFSRMPITCRPVLRQNVSSRRTSFTDTACGVVTKIAPSHLTSLKLFSICNDSINNKM